MLRCTVRNCALPLTRGERSFGCPRGHSFDIARSGYVNLLQPQDKRSKIPGDSAAAVAARRRIHDSGTTQPLLAAIAGLLEPSASDYILDAGCGEGFYLGSLAAASGCCGFGVDLSIPAIDAAARRYPGEQWVVANADRLIPYPDAAFTAVVSITGRLHPAEFMRVLQPGGRLLVAVAAPDDLVELRGQGRDRTARTITDFGAFQLRQQHRVTTTAHLDADAIEDVRTAIYRPLHSESACAQQVTFSFDLLKFYRPRA